MTLLSQVAVDVDSQCATPVQDCCRQPCFAALLDPLLQLLLELILNVPRRIANLRWEESKTADGSFDVRHTLEVFQFIDVPCQVVREINLPFNHFCVP